MKIVSFGYVSFIKDILAEFEKKKTKPNIKTYYLVKLSSFLQA